MQRTSAIVIGVAVIVLAVVLAFLLFGQRAAPPPGDASPSASGAATAAASASLSADLLERRWTVLYVGTDTNETREARGEVPNADALMLVSLSADQSELTLVSLPRDTVDLPLADGSTWDQKINALYASEGLEALVGSMEATFGVPIDAHVVLDMDDFRTLVDAARGIEVDPDEPLSDPAADIDIPAGPQEVDGATALGYVRSRIDQDYGRMARQQEVLVALVAKLVDPDTNVDLATVINGLDSLETDLPLDQLPTLVELARRASEAEVRNVLVEPPLITFEGDRGDGRGYVLEADVDAIRTEVQGLIGE